MLLAKHGLVTWGETGEESYRGTIEFVTRAAHAIDRVAAGGFGLGGAKVAEPGETAVRGALLAALPVLRGALLADSPGDDPRGRPEPGGGRLCVGRADG